MSGLICNTNSNTYHSPPFVPRVKQILTLGLEDLDDIVFVVVLPYVGQVQHTIIILVNLGKELF
jgi:hypothetical protein